MHSGRIVSDTRTALFGSESAGSFCGRSGWHSLSALPKSGTLLYKKYFKPNVPINLKLAHPPSPPPPPPPPPTTPWAFELFSLVVVKFPTPGPKIRSNAPRQDWIQWSNAPSPVHSSSRKSDVIWAEISVSIVYTTDVTNRIVMSATLNIGSPMITEGYGSCFSI